MRGFLLNKFDLLPFIRTIRIDIQGVFLAGLSSSPTLSHLLLIPAEIGH